MPQLLSISILIQVELQGSYQKDMSFCQWVYICWFCSGIVGICQKKISPFMLVPRKDCKNDVQKCLVPKMKSMMDIVEAARKRKGIWKINNFYLGSVPRCKKLFKDVELLFQYPGVSHIWRHEECSYLTIFDLYSKMYGKKFAL